MTVSVPILPPLPAAPIPAEYRFTYVPTLAPVLCTPTIYQDVAVALFGGGTASLPLVPRAPDPLELLGRGLQGLGAQLNPMAPVFTVVKTTAALVNFVTGLPGNVAQAIAFNPTPLVKSVEAVIGSAVDLVALAILPLQLAKMARGFLQILRDYLVALKTQIASLINRYTNVNALIDQATSLGVAAMLANATCARERLDAKVSAINAALTALGVAILLFQVIICFVTGGEVSLTVPTLDANALSGAVFDPLIAIIDGLLAIIPDIPGLALEC